LCTDHPIDNLATTPARAIFIELACLAELTDEVFTMAFDAALLFGALLVEITLEHGAVTAEVLGVDALIQPFDRGVLATESCAVAIVDAVHSAEITDAVIVETQVGVVAAILHANAGTADDSQVHPTERGQGVRDDRRHERQHEA
jgi:hypothetical protein